jgi:hypothetical protein
LVTWTWFTWPGTASTQDPHFVPLWLLPLWGLRQFLAVVCPYNPRTRGPVRALPRPYEFATDPQIGTPHLFHSQVTSQTLKHMHIYAHTFPPHSLNLRDVVSPLIGVLECLWEVISLPFCLLKAGILFEPRFLPV